MLLVVARNHLDTACIKCCRQLFNGRISPALGNIYRRYVRRGTKHNTITKLVFGSLTLLFLLLSIGDFTENHTITLIAGYEGIICGFTAIYSAIGQIINNEHGREIVKL